MLREPKMMGIGGPASANQTRLLGRTVLRGYNLASFAMRDWIMILAPVAATTYFLVYPDQFREFLTWLTILVQ